jgi:hypothetical protein
VVEQAVTNVSVEADVTQSTEIAFVEA